MAATLPHVIYAPHTALWVIVPILQMRKVRHRGDPRLRGHDLRVHAAG